MDFGVICRTCLGTGSLSLIFDQTADHERHSTDIFITTGIKISLNDGLPQQMCVHCVNYLNSSLRFRQQCKDADTKLQQLRKEQSENTDQEIGDKTDDILNIELKCEFQPDKNIQSDEDSDLENDTPLSHLSEKNRNDDGNSCETFTHTVQKENKKIEINGKLQIKKEVQSDDSDMDYTPSETDPLSPSDKAASTPFEEAASAIVNTLLPETSRDKYLKVYNNFLKWRSKKKSTSFSEDILLVYFDELSKTLKPSTLWGIYSMLKATIAVKHNVNIKNYRRLTLILKKLSNGFKSRKSKVLTADNVETFLETAPDQIYLADKVVLIFGVNGACRAAELVNLRMGDIESHNNMILVNLPNTKSQIDRSFVIRDALLYIVKRYMNLRPKDTETDRVSCPFCQKDLSSRSLRAHVEARHGARHRCGCCKLEYGSKETLAAHTSSCPLKKKRRGSETGKELVKCEVCHKAMQRASLRAHVAVKHKGLGPVCEHCGRRFGNKLRLSEHLRAKHGHEKLRCSRCEFTSASSAALQNHERRHRGEKPFVCETCGAKFHAAYLLAQHRQSHRTEKSVKCVLCGAVFKAANSLHAHRLARHGARRHRCPLCARAYSCRHYAVKHLRSVHGFKGPVPPLQVDPVPPS